MSEGVREWLSVCVSVCERMHVYTYVCRDVIDLGLEDCRDTIDFYRRIEEDNNNRHP